MFAKPAEETARRIESRLEDLLASERAADYPDSGAVPGPLQHAVDVLLELVDDVQNATHRRAGAVALFQSRREVACACVGGGEPDVWAHDVPFAAPWITLRESADENDPTPRARGFSLFARADLDMRLQWPYLLGTPRPEGVVVDARWQAPRGFEVTVRRLANGKVMADVPVTARPGVEPSLDASASAGGYEWGAATSDDSGEDPRGEFFAGWFDDLSSQAARDDASATTEAAAHRAGATAFEEFGHETDATPGSFDVVEHEVPPRPIPRATAGDATRVTPRAAIAFPDFVAELRSEVEGDGGSEVIDATPVDPWQDAGAEARIAAHAAAGELLVPMGSMEAVTEGSLGTSDVNALDTSDVHEFDDEFNVVASPRAVRRPQWPRFVRARAQRLSWRRHAWWLAFIVALFAAGWWLGTRGASRPALASGRAPFPVQVLRAVGLASPRFAVRITSNPAGAAIKVDGKLSAFRTPAELELPPGARSIGLTLPDLGTVTQVVEGKRGEVIPLDVALTGSLQVVAPNPATPVSIVLDGESRGFAPLQLSKIAPGAHDLVYTSPGQPSWSQTVTVPVRGDVRIVARPFDLPAMGIIHVGATFTDDDGSTDLKGAEVLIDGERRGVTPLTLELPRGPHSLRANYRGESVPIQVIELPGGNERFASFSFGLGTQYPRLVLQSPLGSISRSAYTPVTVSLQGLSTRDVREVWLHVKAQDGAWTRYPMNVMPGSSGPAATVVFPANLLDAHGDAAYYVSALVSTGEEYFTDIVGNTGTRSVSRAPRKPAAAAVPVPAPAPAPKGTIKITPSLPAAEIHSAPIEAPPVETPATPSTP